MIIADRIKEQMAVHGFSQAELARRVGVAQPTIFALIHRNKIGSKHIHKIARELGTTPAYLTGETDSPDEDAPAPAELDSESRELVERFTSLSASDRRALLQVARSMSEGHAAPGAVHSRRSGFEHEPAHD